LSRAAKCRNLGRQKSEYVVAELPGYVGEFREFSVPDDHRTGREVAMLKVLRLAAAALVSVALAGAYFYLFEPEHYMRVTVV
jgi:hypothetical protein